MHYIAGPETGYRVLKNVKGPHFPNWYPFGLNRPGYPIPDFNDDYADKNIGDIFDNPKEHLSTAASGHVKPSKNNFGVSSDGDKGLFDDKAWDSFGDNLGKPSVTKKPSIYRPNGVNKPAGSKPFIYDGLSDDDSFGDDLFQSSAGGSVVKPSKEIKSPERPSQSEDGASASTHRPSTTGSSFFEDELPKPFPTPDEKFDLFWSGKGSSSDDSNADKPSFDKIPDLGETVHIGASFDGNGTILKNIGDKSISFAPGVAVRAHVQSIDILPYGSRLPSPSEQLKSETGSNDTEKKDD